MPSASCCHVASRNSVRAYFFTESWTISAKSWVSQSRRANPVRAKPCGSRPRLVRSYTAGMSFLRDRSPVTPKITRPQGPAMRGRRLSRGSRSGFTHPSGDRLLVLRPAVTSGRPLGPALVQLALHRVAELGPRLLELVDALVLEDQEHVAQVDPHPLQPVEHLLRLGGGAGDPVAVDLAVVGERQQGLLRHRVDR